VITALALALCLQAKGSIDWVKSIDDAKKASNGKKPIAVFLTQKGCPLSIEFFKNLQKDDRLGELASAIVWLPILIGTDEYKTWFVKTCGSNVAGTPSLLFLNPKGDNADPDYAGLGTVTSPDPDDIIPALRAVVQRAKQPVSEKDKAKVKESMAKAGKAGTAGEAIAAWRLAIHAGDGWQTESKSVAEAREGIEKKLQEGAAEMLRIQASIRDAQAQLKAYEAVKMQWIDTNVAEWAADEILRLKRAAK
jgi:hypothetical protein